MKFFSCNLFLTAALLFGSCSSPTAPDTLAFVDESPQVTLDLAQAKQQFLVDSQPTLPVPLGNETQPFVRLPQSDEPKAGITPSGVVVPIVAKQDTSWLAITSCQNPVTLKDITPIHSAHVVLDPGHGGREPGAVGYNGLRESDLNLQVANKSKELLEAKGASVALTRTGDYSLTVASRGFIAEQINPALFVSIHHNGGANGFSEDPGTIVLHKHENEEAERFGGIFYEKLQSALEPIGAEKKAAHAEYVKKKEAFEEELEAYEQSVAADKEAQQQTADIDSAEATSPEPDPNENATAELTPPEFDVEEIPAFNWSGGPNAGVRAWKRADNKDYLGVLRNSGTTPAALVEFLYLSNPSEADLLADEAFIETQAQVLTDSIVDYFSNPTLQGSGFVADQQDDQPIGGGGSKASCTEPELQ